MLHILCILLKIIGILIFVILGLFVLLTGILLFVPVRYRIEMKGKGTLQSMEARVKFSWFLHALSGYVFYADKKTDWQVRTAWKKWNVPKSEKKTQESIQPIIQPKKEETPTEEKEEKPPEKVAEQTEKIQPPKEPKQVKRTKTKEKKIFQKIKRMIRNICDKIKAIGEKKDRVAEFLADELHQNALKTGKKEVIRLLKYLRPKKIKGRVHFGFSDPYLTGKTLAILSVWYPFYADTLSIAPDFEESVLEGELTVKGCVRGYYFLLPALNIARSKEVRQTYKHIRTFQL